MPLTVLLVLVVGGIAGIAVLLHVLGMTQARGFDAASARTAWARENPDLPIQQLWLSDDGHAGLVLTAQGPGLVWAMGADSAARLVPTARLHSHRRGLRIATGSYDAPSVTVTLTDAQAETWRAVFAEAQT